MNYFRLLCVMLLFSAGAHAQLTVSPAYDVKWKSHKNSMGDTWLALENTGGWGAATSKNRMLPSQDVATIQYRLDRLDGSMAFGFNDVLNDDDTTNQISLYFKNIDMGFIYHEHTLYTIIDGKMGFVMGEIDTEKVLTLEYQKTDKSAVLFYIDDQVVDSSPFQGDTVHITSMLMGSSTLNKLVCDFGYPLEVAFGKNHVTTEEPVSGLLIVNAEGGTPPYRFLCAETGSTDAMQAGLEPGTYHITVKDSLNDSLMIRADIGIANNWRILREMALSDSGYVKTGTDSGKVAAAVAYNMITENENGFCEVAVTESTDNLAFGFMGFERSSLLEGYDLPLVQEQAIEELLTYADSLLIHNRIDPSALKISEAYKRLHLAYFKDGIVRIGFQAFTVPDNNPVTYRPGDLFRMQRTDGVIRLYKNNLLIATSNIDDLETQTLLSALFVKEGTATVRGNASLNLHDGIRAAELPVWTCNDPALNWVSTRTFDENGVVKSESKAYMDQLGRNIQNQVKQFSKNSALVSEPLFDSWGRAIGQSLAAPSFQSELCYVGHFIQRSSTTAYAPADFDNPVGTGLSGDILDAFHALGDVNHPKSVYNGTQGKLGWYYSNNNTAEPLVAADALPYARVEFYDNGRIRRSAGVGSVLNMGSGHETHFIYTSTPQVTDPASNELNAVFPYGTYELEKTFGVFPNAINHNLQLFKTISINPDGRDQIAYTNAAGQTIATCITGDGNGCVSHLEKKVLYPQSTQEKLQNIYVPAAKSGTLRFREFDAANTAQPTAAVPALTDLMTNTTLLSGTDYTYDSNTGYFTFTGNYAGRSLYLQLTYSGSVTPTATLAVTAETDYTQWTLYFYDRKGRLLANTSPNDLQCQTLPIVAQRISQQGDPGMSCPNNRVSSMTFNNDVKNAGDAFVYISITDQASPLYAFSNSPSAMYLLKSDSLKYVEDSLYFLNDTIVKDSLFIDAQDTTMIPAYMFPTDSALAMYRLLDSLETQVPVNAMRGKEVHYSGGYAVYARFAHDSLGAEPLTTIPYDFTVSGDGTTDSNGGAVLRLVGGHTGIRVKIKINIEAGDMEGLDVKVKNPKIDLYNFGSDAPDVAGCQGPHPWVPNAYHPLIDGIGQATTPGVDIDALVFPTALTIPFANKYMYDEYDRLVGSINEDQGTVYYVYDQKEDKLLFTQNQKQRDNGGKFSCIVYDKLARPVVSGEYDPAHGGPTTGDTPYLFQDYYTWKAGTTLPSGRISTGVPAAANTDVYNDGHLFDRTFIDYDNADLSLPTTIGSDPQTYKQKYTAAKVSKTRNDHTTTWYSYDELGRQSWTVQHDNVLGYKTLNYSYDFRGKLLASAYQFVQADNLVHRYTYNADERLSTASYGVYLANTVNFMKPLAAYDYYLHGPLKRSVLGNNLQGLDYVYTIDGKLKAMNNPVNAATGSDPGLDGYATGPHAAVSPDAFGYALEYYPGDYERSGSPIRSYNNATAYSNNLSYTGLVKAQSWHTVLPSAATNAYSTGLMYEYQYDEQYRLTGATFGGITETAPTLGNPTWSNTFTQKPEYKLENIDYDKNGNLQHLKRYAAPINSTTAHLLDNLTYNYNGTKKNKLEKVGDAATNTAGYTADLDLPDQTNSSNYVYNSIGELVENKQEGLGYEYNAAGLVTKVYTLSNHNPVTEYRYNDKGLRYSKTTYSGGIFNIETEQLFYVYDGGSAEIATYKKLVQIPNTVYQLQHHTLYAAGRAGLLDKGTGKALFELSDHLGNVRAVVADNGSGVAETVSYTDYYPHGGVLPGRTYQSSLNFPYGYQGQEKDQTTGLTNFELRQYDPRIGRWYNPDPYGQHHSPYLAMSNNPVSFTDPDGGWDAGYGADDAERDARWEYMSGAQNAFINGDADSYINGLENMATVKHAYNDYRARHTNENGQWGNWMTGGSTRDLGDESHTHFDIDESAKIDNSFFSRISWFAEKPPLFNTPDKAAEDFVRRYNQKSFDEKREYLTLIVKEKKDNKIYYTYLDPVPGGDGTTGAFQPSLADYNRSVADAHTHQQWEETSYDDEKKIDWNNRFGEEDMKGNIRLKRDGYVGTPNGSLLKFNYKTKRITLISKDMPYDKKHYKNKKSLNYENLNINYFKP